MMDARETIRSFRFDLILGAYNRDGIYTEIAVADLLILLAKLERLEEEKGENNGPN